MFADETGTIPLPAAAKLTKLDLPKQLKEILVDHCYSVLLNAEMVVGFKAPQEWSILGHLNVNSIHITVDFSTGFTGGTFLVLLQGETPVPIHRIL